MSFLWNDGDPWEATLLFRRMPAAPPVQAGFADRPDTGSEHPLRHVFLLRRKNLHGYSTLRNPGHLPVCLSPLAGEKTGGGLRYHGQHPGGDLVVGKRPEPQGLPGLLPGPEAGAPERGSPRFRQTRRQVHPFGRVGQSRSTEPRPDGTDVTRSEADDQGGLPAGGQEESSRCRRKTRDFPPNSPGLRRTVLLGRSSYLYPSARVSRQVVL